MRLKLFFLSLLLIFSESFIIREPVKCLGGLELGTITLISGKLMDKTISKKSTHRLQKQNPKLYQDGLKTATNNLMLVGPSYYWGVENFILSHQVSNNLPLETLLLVMIHSLGYYSVHRLMHRSDLFRKYHYFHHQFNETLIPTIGNSVSMAEFTFAYMSPFIIGCLLINPGQDSFNCAILIVSIMNLVIHTPEMSNITWSNWLVSPKTHLFHHQGKNPRSTYSAPTFNLEFIYQKITDFFSRE